DPRVRQAEADDAGGVEAHLLRGLEDGGAEAADDAVVLDGDDGDAALEQGADEGAVNGLGEAGVVDGDAEFGREVVGGAEGVDGGGAEGEDGDVRGVRAGLDVERRGEAAGLAEDEGGALLA